MKQLKLVVCLTCISVLFASYTAVAAPDRRDAEAFVKDLDATVKASAKILKSGDSVRIGQHSQKINSLKGRSKELFVDADACSFAMNSALQLWANQRLNLSRPDKSGEIITKRAAEDYMDNMGLCKKSLSSFK